MKDDTRMVLLILFLLFFGLALVLATGRLRYLPTEEVPCDEMDNSVPFVVPSF